MIRVHITSTTQEDAFGIANMLIEQKLAVETHVFRPALTVLRKDNAASSIEEYLIEANTKALLFEDIERELSVRMPGRFRAIWATPIVHMPAQLASLLRAETRPV